MNNDADHKERVAKTLEYSMSVTCGVDISTIHAYLKNAWMQFPPGSRGRKNCPKIAYAALKESFPDIGSFDDFMAIIEGNPVLRSVWGRGKFCDDVVEVPTDPSLPMTTEKKDQLELMVQRSSLAIQESYDFASALQNVGMGPEDIQACLGASQLVSGMNLVQAFQMAHGTQVQTLIDVRREIEHCRKMAHDDSKTDLGDGTSIPNVPIEAKLEYERRVVELMDAGTKITRSIQDGLEIMSRAQEAANESARSQGRAASSRKAVRV